MAWFSWHGLGYKLTGTFFFLEPTSRRSEECFGPSCPWGALPLMSVPMCWHTLLMASLVGSRGRVLAIEPNPALRHRLHNHLCINHFSQAEIIPCAAADTERMTDFYAPAANDLDSGNGHVVEAGPAEHGGTIRVETRRMDAIVSAAGVERLRSYQDSTSRDSNGRFFAVERVQSPS